MDHLARCRGRFRGVCASLTTMMEFNVQRIQLQISRENTLCDLLFFTVNSPTFDFMVLCRIRFLFGSQGSQKVT
jgi:hypothetical protein